MPSRRPASARNVAHESDDLLAEIGRALAAARRARGEDIHDAASALRIRVDYLRALEAGDFGTFPGRPYALGFLKTYCDYLDLDGDSCIRVLKESTAPIRDVATLRYREPVAEAARSYKLLGAAAVAAAALLYVGWYVYSSGQVDLGSRVAEFGDVLGDRAAEMVAGDEVQPAAPVNEPGDASLVLLSAPTPSLEQLRLDAPEAEPVRPPPTARASDAASAQAAEGPAVTAGSMLAELEAERARGPGVAGDAGPGRVALLAHETSWIQIRSESRDYVRTKTLDAGQMFVLPNRDDLALWTGNAGGVEVLVDGQSIGLLGRRGDVLRALPLSVEALEARRTAMR
ncbi:MAG: helix-turn-helix domain-containing protein [Geminicoccaceae bacterium]